MGGSVGASHYTFLACEKCGVQSPPIILYPHGMYDLPGGWEIKQHKYSISALCPKCHAEEE